jgi:hypothetical protein
MPPFSPQTLAFLTALAASYRHWKGEALVPGQAGLAPAALAAALFDLPLPLVAHGAEADPIFCFGNRAALKLWEMSWADFTRLPSRQSAEAAAGIQQDRNAALAAAMARGFVDDYAGTRVSATGKRFEIRNCTLWNVVDAQGNRLGQAALVGGVKYQA